MKNLMKLAGVAVLMLVAFNVAPLEAEDVPSDWSYIGESMVWDGETEQYMQCVTYTSQSCLDQCNLNRDVCGLSMNPNGSQAFSSDYCDAEVMECKTALLPRNLSGSFILCAGWDNISPGPLFSHSSPGNLPQSKDPTVPPRLLRPSLPFFVTSL